MVHSALMAQILAADSLHYSDGVIWAIRNQALVENTQGNLDKQMNLTMKALKMAEKSGQLHTTGILYNDIGNILVEQNNPAQALVYLKKSLLIKRQFNEQAEIAKTLNNIGSSCMRLKQFDSALYYLRESEKLKLSLHDERGLGFTYENIGLIYEEEGQYQIALTYLQQSLQYYTTSDNKPGMGKAWLNLGRVNTLLKHYDTANGQLREAARINATLKNAKNEMIY